MKNNQCLYCDQRVCAAIENPSRKTYAYIEVDEDGAFHYVVRNGGNIIHVVEIDYCPFCGRNLINNVKV